MSDVEIVIDQYGKKWKVITLPDSTGGETVLAIEVKND